MENTRTPHPRTNPTPRHNGNGRDRNAARIHAEAREAAEYAELFEKFSRQAADLGMSPSKESLDKEIQTVLARRREQRAQRDAQRVPCKCCGWRHDPCYAFCKRCTENFQAQGLSKAEAIAKVEADNKAKAEAKARRAIEALTNESVRELLRAGKLLSEAKAEVDGAHQVVTIGHRTFRFIRDGYLDEVVAAGRAKAEAEAKAKAEAEEAARLAARVPCKACGWLHNPGFPFCKKCANLLKEEKRFEADLGDETWAARQRAVHEALDRQEAEERAARHQLALRAYEAFLVVEEMPEGVEIADETDTEVKFRIGNVVVVMAYLPSLEIDNLICDTDEVDAGWDAIAC